MFFYDETLNTREDATEVPILNPMQRVNTPNGNRIWKKELGYLGILECIFLWLAICMNEEAFLTSF